MDEIGFVESPMIGKMLSEVQARAKAEGRTEGMIEERAENILRFLRTRPGKLPKSLVTAITTCTDAEQLSLWLDMVLAATTVAEFRQRAGL